MDSTLNDLYLNFFSDNAETVEENRYFQYLFALAQAGDCVLNQNNKTLHKVVDEEWIGTIEDALDALYYVTEHPRRFVTTKEEIVPVSLARRISAESVMHLSQNTQYISSDANGEIMPSKILNVSSEESIDLYENRFIYHLIQRLVTFIDKRTDLIFWRTGDQTMDTITMKNRIDDAFEVIEYKLEMKILNQKSTVENDSDNMQTFMRIDRVRRMVMRLRNSSFCEIMAGCQVVRSPIQRTNLIVKDPQYRTCYQLWQFLEHYDKVGYTIEELDTPLEFDEEYVNQLNMSMIANYSLFKSILEEDKRDPEAVPPKRRKIKKPKFLKTIQEEIVDDYNIKDVEIRKVIIEEVTQAQLDAEAKLAEETKRADRAEQECRDAVAQATDAVNRMQFAEEQLSVAEYTMNQALADKEEAERTVARVVHDSKESIEKSEQARVAAEKKSEEDEAARLDMEVKLREALSAKREAVEHSTRMEQERDSAEQQMLADRLLREKAQKNENAAVRERDETAAKNAELSKQNKEYIERYEHEAAERAEAQEARIHAEGLIDDAVQKRNEAVAECTKAKAEAKQSYENMHAFERAKNTAEFRLKAANETIRKVTQERKQAQQFAQRDRDALKQAEDERTQAAEALQALQEERNQEIAARAALEQRLAELESELSAERAARIKAEEKASSGRIFGRSRSKN